METVPTQPSIDSSPRFRGEMMQQVYKVWLFRRLAPVLIAEVLVIAGVLYWLAKAIFLQRILQNALNVFFANPSGIILFFISAFSHAPLLTKMLSIVLAVLVALVVRHLTQGLLRLLLVRSNYFSKVK